MIHEDSVAGRRFNFKWERIPQPRGLAEKKFKRQRFFKKWNLNVCILA